MIQLFLDVIDDFSKIDQWKDDFFVILEPTCLIRKSNHLDFLFNGDFFERETPHLHLLSKHQQSERKSGIMMRKQKMAQALKYGVEGKNIHLNMF